MNYTSEIISLPVKRYKDDQGNPTCAVDFETGEVCQFYITQRFGCHEGCLLSEQHKGPFQAMHRRGNDGGGTLIPLKDCPVWK